MSSLVIQGGKRLKGEVHIAGMKNAATPIIAATLLTREPCVLQNVPKIADVQKMIAIIQSCGVEVRWTADHELTIVAAEVDPTKINRDSICALRSSVLLASPLLARAGVLDLPEPGGCIIGNRPLDTHLHVFETMGVAIGRNNGTYEFRGRPKAATIVLPEFSVTATENAIMAAVLAVGVTTIKLAAAEPHIQDLCAILIKMGAKINGVGTHTLSIEGVSELHGVTHAIIPDQVEVGTFAVLAAATHSDILLGPIVPEHIDSIVTMLGAAGARFKLQTLKSKGGMAELHIIPSAHLQGFKVQAMPYPGFPTDLQAPAAVLATQCKGTSLIHDPLFEGRMGYVHELIKMGANAIVADPHRVIVSGPTPLYGQEIKSLDLRAGATLVIAGLIAEGETIIHDAEVIDRGYEDIEGRLQKIGATIKKI